MAQRRTKHKPLLLQLSVDQMRLNLLDSVMSLSPGLRLFIPTFKNLPSLGYLVPEDIDFCYKASPEFPELPLTPSVEVWGKANAYPIPAIRFRVDSLTSDGGYGPRCVPEFSFGILVPKTVKNWPCVPNIRQFWIPPIWFLTDCPPEHFESFLYSKAKGRPLTSDFLMLENLTTRLDDDQKAFLSVIFLHPYWIKHKLPHKIRAEHLIQLKHKKNLGVNNFWNYSVEAGLGRMSDSQVKRLCAKLVNARFQIKAFHDSLEVLRQRELKKFLSKKRNRRNPFIFSLLSQRD